MTAPFLAQRSLSRAHSSAVFSPPQLLHALCHELEVGFLALGTNAELIPGHLHDTLQALRLILVLRWRSWHKVSIRHYVMHGMAAHSSHTSRVRLQARPHTWSCTWQQRSEGPLRGTRRPSAAAGTRTAIRLQPRPPHPGWRTPPPVRPCPHAPAAGAQLLHLHTRSTQLP